jgi:isocitrate dehydrogenase
MTGQLLKSLGGFLLAAKNLEGDMFSEIVANVYTTHGLMYNEVRGQNGERLFETNHGTLERHFEQFVAGEPNYSNPSATIYVWAKALQRRAMID